MKPHICLFQTLVSIENSCVVFIVNKLESDLDALVKWMNLKNATLRRTAKLVQKEKLAGYQENLLKQLLRAVWNSLI